MPLVARIVFPEAFNQEHFLLGRLRILTGSCVCACEGVFASGSVWTSHSSERTSSNSSARLSTTLVALDVATPRPKQLRSSAQYIGCRTYSYGPERHNSAFSRGLGSGESESPSSLALHAIIPMPPRKQKKPAVVIKSLSPLAGNTTNTRRTTWSKKYTSPRSPSCEVSVSSSILNDIKVQDVVSGYESLSLCLSLGVLTYSASTSIELSEPGVSEREVSDVEEVGFASKNPFVGGVGAESSEEALTARRARVLRANPFAPVLVLAKGQMRVVAGPDVDNSIGTYRRRGTREQQRNFCSKFSRSFERSEFRFSVDPSPEKLCWLWPIAYGKRDTSWVPWKSRVTCVVRCQMC